MRPQSYWGTLVVCLVLAGCERLEKAPAPAREKGKFTLEKTEYKGWKNNLRLSNGDAELVITLDVGPRIISYRLAGGPNVFKEYEDQLGKSGEKEWQIRGGHRLWVGPEDLTRTYALDNGPVDSKELGPGAILVKPPADAEYGIQKEIEVRLAAEGSKVTLIHRLKNIADKPAELAAWTLSVMAPGGVEIIPLPAKKPHPGAAKNAKSPKDFAPNQFMALWPFFDFKDSRWSFGTKYLTLRQDAQKGPTKVGLAHQMGWVAYLNKGNLFVKRLEYLAGTSGPIPYPDGGCNFETFTNEDMLEVESLGPLVTLAPGKVVEHIEHWELHKDVGDFDDEAGIDKNVLSKIK